MFLRYREAVQAWYFSHRLATDDTTGADHAFNHTGLEERPHRPGRAGGPQTSTP